MLIGFLIRDADDFEDWKRRVREVKGKPIVQVYLKSPPGGENKERKEAVDEVETWDDEDENEEDAVTVTGREGESDERQGHVKHEEGEDEDEDQRQARRVKVMSESEDGEGMAREVKIEDGVGRDMLVGVGRGAES